MANSLAVPLRSALACLRDTAVSQFLADLEREARALHGIIPLEAAIISSWPEDRQRRVGRICSGNRKAGFQA